MIQLKLGDIIIDVEQKDIKNIYLSVHWSDGRVRIAAPLRMDLETIRVYALSKLNWIKKQQAKFMGRDREPPREYLNMESHYYRGKRYLLKVIEFETQPRIELEHNTLVMYIRPGTPVEKKQKILEEWYRAQLKKIVPALIDKWEKELNVRVSEFGIKKMKTRWGTCNRLAKRIWLNLDLAKKPPECLEYIVVHEMVHFFERKHNSRFAAYMDEYLPKWRVYRDELNRQPI